MPRYIDADALGICRANPAVFDHEEYAHGWNAVIKLIDDAPTIDPESLRARGKWIRRKSWNKYVCSKCSFEEENARNYCPTCGAKMEVETD